MERENRESVSQAGTLTNTHVENSNWGGEETKVEDIDFNEVSIETIDEESYKYLRNTHFIVNGSI